MPTTKQRRVALALKRKVQLIKQADMDDKRKGKFAVGISFSTLSNIVKDKEKMLDGFEQSFSTKRKHLRKCNTPELEAALLQWLKSTRPPKFQSGQETVTKLDLTANAFPPLWFSRVKSFTSVAESPL